MTICVSIKVAEGLVFAADSATTLEGEIVVGGKKRTGVVQTFGYANKVTQFIDYPIGVMSWGLGSIEDRTIQSLIMEHEWTYPDTLDNEDYEVATIASDLVGFIAERYEAVYQPPKGKPLGLLIGGYSDGAFFAEQYRFEFPKSKELEVVRPDSPDGRPSFGANWFGLGDALVRLINGYDPDAMKELIRRGASKDIVRKWVDDRVPELPLVFDGMPLQDAIDFANYCVQVVIGRWRFGVGAPLCGGDIDIAVIRPGSFGWAQRKQWAIKE